MRMSRRKEIYSAPWWLSGAHGQTIWGKLFRPRRPLPFRRRTIRTADEDEIELLSIGAPSGAPHLLLLHGLEGSVRSHYANGILATASEAGWAAHLLVFRSCGDRINLTRRFYHSGDTADVRTALELLVGEFPDAEFCLAGVSLGGNVLLKYLGEDPAAVPENIRAAAAISVPYDLARSARRISNGISRIYQKFFLSTLKKKVLEKRQTFPELPDESVIRRIRTMVEFDDLVTAPVHGFEGAADYYYKSSAVRFLDGIRLPTLLLSSYDDPFLPSDLLHKVAEQAERNPALHIEFHRTGGHVGFIHGRRPWRPQYYIDRRILEFFEQFIHFVR